VIFIFKLNFYKKNQNDIITSKVENVSLDSCADNRDVIDFQKRVKGKECDSPWI